MSTTYDAGIDASAMRCPRCLRPWDPSWVDLVAESASCRPCQLTVALLGAVVPRWELPDVAGQLDAVERTPPWAEGITISERAGGRHLELRGEARWLRTRPTLTLDADGAVAQPGDVHVALPEIARVIPVAIFGWERFGSSKTLEVHSVVRALPRAANPAAAELAVPTWSAARYLAARLERVRRTLCERGTYR